MSTYKTFDVITLSYKSTLLLVLMILTGCAVDPSTGRIYFFPGGEQSYPACATCPTCPICPTTPITTQGAGTVTLEVGRYKNSANVTRLRDCLSPYKTSTQMSSSNLTTVFINYLSESEVPYAIEQAVRCKVTRSHIKRVTYSQFLQ